MALVYQHKRKDNGVIFYIGFASDKQQHFRPFTSYGRSKFWERTVDMYGLDVEIVIKDISEAEALSWEKYLISIHGRRDKKNGWLVNLTDGGEGVNGVVFTEEAKKKISEATKVRFSDKTNHPLYGKTGMDNPQYGRKRSDQFKQNQSKDKQGFRNPMYGKKGGLCPNSKKVTDGVTVWGSLTEAAKYFGYKHQYISKMLLGQRKNKHNLRYL